MADCKIEQSCGYLLPECLDEIAGTSVAPPVGEYFWNADKKIFHLACQLLLDIPILKQFIKSAIIGNDNGYTVKISPDSLQVFEDDLYNALENKNPSGDLVVESKRK